MKKSVVIVLFCIVSLLLGVVLILFLVKANEVKVYLKGDNKVTIDVLSTYNDKGIIVKKGKKILNKNKYKYDVKTNLDTNIVGQYKYTYIIKYKNKKFKLFRNINVVDELSPEINLSDDKIVKDFCTGKISNEIHYTAIDKYDGDITNNVTVEEKEDKYIYRVTDSSGNETVKEINIDYGNKPADKFYLNGKEKIKVTLGSNYVEQGVSYTDGCGKPLKGDIKVEGEVNTSVEGDYTITYTLNDGKKLTRLVTVYEKHYEPKTIYLTFDDGPGVNTRKVLDTLNKYGVKATFFVTNQFPAYQSLIGEEHNSGHKVAVHTYSHRYENIYTSVDAYINDFNQMNEIVKTYTGNYTNMFRFPGGSSNTVSRRYATGVITDIASEMTNRGYVYFDWNLSSGDADGKTGTSGIIYNVVNRVDSCPASCIILFHDYKKTTADALDPILSELTQRGYTFSTLNENSPTAHFKIAN